MSDIPTAPGPVEDLRRALAEATRTASTLSAWAERLAAPVAELGEHLAAAAHASEALHRAYADELATVADRVGPTTGTVPGHYGDAVLTAGDLREALTDARALSALVAEATTTAATLAQLPADTVAEVEGELRSLVAVVREGTAGAREALDVLATVDLVEDREAAALARRLLAARKVATLNAWRRNLHARREALHRGRVLARKVRSRAVALSAGSLCQRTVGHTGPPRRRYCPARRFTPSRGEDPSPPRPAGCPTRGSYVAGSCQ